MSIYLLIIVAAQGRRKIPCIEKVKMLLRSLSRLISIDCYHYEIAIVFFFVSNTPEQYHLYHANEYFSLTLKIKDKDNLLFT